MSYDSNYTEHPDLMGELYEEAMNILRQDFGDSLLGDADLPESEWDMNIDEADAYAFDEEECARDFYVDPKF
jgi:hypothetical protein|tara:strand:+ start:78 stop:293 length:216 start_codon:yes stop_codon:yes gene_type:complete